MVLETSQPATSGGCSRFDFYTAKIVNKYHSTKYLGKNFKEKHE